MACTQAGATDFADAMRDIANKPVVISVTRLLADGKANDAIPADAELHGTIRSFENIDASEDGQAPLKTVAAFVGRMATEAGVQHNWSIAPGLRRRNDAVLFDQVVRPLMRSWPGVIDTHPRRGMFAEDFAYYTQAIPSLYFSLGVARDGRGTAGVHTTEFDVHPAAFDEELRLMNSLVTDSNVASGRTWHIFRFDNELNVRLVIDSQHSVSAGANCLRS